MRKIQFKAWDKVNKKFITDYKRVLPTHYEGSKFPIEHGGVNHNCVYVPICDESNKGLADIGGYIDDCILLLWTCLKDKTGQEIYEGDILKIEHEERDTIITDVKFIDGAFCVKSSWNEYYPMASLARPGDDLEIIGNIYENPELIK